jgi:hypothetical protein
MFHIELRQFPHNFCHFNLSDGELEALLAPWREGHTIEVGERKWDPHRAKLTVLEGPELELQELSMGRGWRTAERRSQDVTDKVLPAHVPRPAAPAATPAAGAVQADPAAVPGTTPAGSPSGAPGLADPLAALVQIGALLGPEAPRLLEAWRAAAAEDPSKTPSQALAVAEERLRRDAGSMQTEPPGG